jgi:hypothetical protein
MELLLSRLDALPPHAAVAAGTTAFGVGGFFFARGVRALKIAPDRRSSYEATRLVQSSAHVILGLAAARRLRARLEDSAGGGSLKKTEGTDEKDERGLNRFIESEDGRDDPLSLFCVSGLAAMFAFELLDTFVAFGSTGKRPVTSVLVHHAGFLSFVGSCLVLRRFLPIVATGGTSEILVVTTVLKAWAKRNRQQRLVSFVRALAMAAMLTRLSLDALWLRIWLRLRPGQWNGDSEDRLRAATNGLALSGWLLVFGLDALWTQQLTKTLARKAGLMIR